MTLFGRALARAFGQIGRSPGTHAMAALALGLTCFLAGAFGLVLSNLDDYFRLHQGHASFRISWKAGADLEAVRAQWDQIRAMPGVDAFSGFAPGPGQGPLSGGHGREGQATAVASLRADTENMRPYLAFTRSLKALPDVDAVAIDPLQLDMATALRGLSAKALLPLSLSLCLAIAVVAYLAARLCLEGQRAEVEILRLVGAREWFVRLPWAVGAAVTGLAGALAGLGTLHGAQAALSGALYEPPLWIRLGPLPLDEAGAMALMAMAMSGLGGWLAARE